MIRRALELREALDAYAFKLRLSSDPYNKETFTDDLIKDEDWDVLKIIKDYLEPLFLLMKSLEGNAMLKETAGKPSHGALWEILLVFQFLLIYWEEREKEAKAGDFNGHEGIQSSITLAWNVMIKWYRKTD